MTDDTVSCVFLRSATYSIVDGIVFSRPRLAWPGRRGKVGATRLQSAAAELVIIPWFPPGVGPVEPRGVEPCPVEGLNGALTANALSGNSSHTQANSFRGRAVYILWEQPESGMAVIGFRGSGTGVHPLAKVDEDISETGKSAILGFPSGPIANPGKGGSVEVAPELSSIQGRLEQVELAAAEGGMECNEGGGGEGLVAVPVIFMVGARGGRSGGRG
ncbi:hypothetical protein Salat_1722700 [Sesamum alatum]|uniref:Uncharacterized protein n=1 Tax=Sesamum alatum TaxID=300844 RepID=A0AAE1Y7T1_9LAMI|nr:hypothetical protein Salat_1722700 [Sesamum alatum]